MAYIPSELSFVGIALETTVGTPVAPTNFLRPLDFKPVDSIPALTDDYMQGSMGKTYDVQQGILSGTYQVDGNLYADEINWYLASILGDVAVTGASDPYTTTHAVLNTSPGQPKTYTLTDYNGNDARSFASARCQSLNVKFAADGLATISAQWVTQGSATASTPTVSYPTATRALPSWKAAASVNSVTSVKVLDMEWDLKRTVPLVPLLNNTQVPDIYAGGDVECTGSATIVFDTAQGPGVFTLYRAQTQFPLSLDLTATTPVESAAHEVKFTATKAFFDGASIDRASGRYVELMVTFQGVMNTTDAGASGGKSPVKVVTKAQLPSGTYF